MILCPNDLMSGLIFKIGVANQAILKMQNHGGPQHRDQPASGLHFSAHLSSACLGSCSVFRVFTTFEGSRRPHAGCVRTQAQANPKMQNNSWRLNRDQPVSGLHFSAHHFFACLGSCSVFRVFTTFEGSRRPHAGCVRTQASVQSLQILTHL
jgi:hypothetical protein